MDVGLHLIFQNFGGALDDAEHWRIETEVGLLAEPLGFDKVWVVEHHFTDYAACPDNAQFLAWLAARTERIQLATGAFILPWNDPLRVAEKIAMLDHQCGGRAVLGIGRGLARREFAGFGIDMEESRDRFDEAAAAVIDALETGTFKCDGRFHQRDATPLRPRPLAGFRDRIYSIGMSPDSAEQAGRLGVRLASFAQTTDEAYAAGSLERYRRTYRDTHGTEPPPPMLVDLMYCGPAGEATIAAGRHHLSEYYIAVVNHYELMSEHFKTTKGYASYGSAVDFLNELGLEAQIEGYLSVQSWGSPEQILERLARRREVLGEFEYSVIARYGSLTFDQVRDSLTLFSNEVLPELKRW